MCGVSKNNNDKMLYTKQTNTIHSMSDKQKVVKIELCKRRSTKKICKYIIYMYSNNNKADYAKFSK